MKTEREMQAQPSLLTDTAQVTHFQIQASDGPLRGGVFLFQHVSQLPTLQGEKNGKLLGSLQMPMRTSE